MGVVSGQLHVPAALLPRKEPGWEPEPVWIRQLREKFPAPAGIRNLVAQPVDLSVAELSCFSHLEVWDLN
jgi:hypothetical protein